MADLMISGGAVPAHLRAAGLDDTTKALMGGGNTYKRISIKGSVFRMVINGNEVAKNEDRAMNVVIVAAAPKNARTFYGKTFVEGEVLRPDCASADGITPDASSTNKQSDLCATCPQNIAGSGQNGSRACRYSRRLAVMLENDLASGEIYQLVLPAQSIFGQGENGKLPLEAYARYLGAQGISVAAVVTEMRFDTSSATPKLTFKAVRYLDAAEYATALERGQSPDAQSAINVDPASIDLANKQPAIAAPKPVYSEPAPKATKTEKPDIVKFVEEEEEEEAAMAEPVKRESAKPVVVKKSVTTILDDWE